jgi:predicted dehydrogenase
MPPACRWGILGTANIARKNWKGIRLSGNGVVAAVASRTPDRARQFISECQSEVPFEQAPAAVGYEELLARADVDAVYVPLPTGIRREWVLKAAAAGKHVLCEKPCGADAAEVRAMVDACRAAGVQFMDGVMFMHSARLPLLRKVLDDGESVGELRRVTSQFSFAADAGFLSGNIRVSSALEPLGALGDLGWYNLRFALWVMKFQMPERVVGRVLHEHASDGRPVPLEFAGELFFPGGVSGSFYCSFRTELQQWAHISGDKGCVTVEDFVLPYHGAETAFVVQRPHFRVQGCTFHMESHPTRYAAAEASDGREDAQETNMARRFGELVLGGKPDHNWADMALKTQLVLDACLRSARDGGRVVGVTG